MKQNNQSGRSEVERMIEEIKLCELDVWDAYYLVKYWRRKIKDGEVLVPDRRPSS